MQAQSQILASGDSGVAGPAGDDNSDDCLSTGQYFLLTSAQLAHISRPWELPTSHLEQTWKPTLKSPSRDLGAEEASQISVLSQAIRLLLQMDI
jgi:hypothetical protein